MTMWNNDHKRNPQPFDLAEYLDQLDDIPWLVHLGEPSQRDTEVFRIYSPDLWPGPENPGSEIQSAYYMKWTRELLNTDSPHGHDRVWDAIHARVLDVARRNVPYDDEEDAWFWPNAAVWQAAWIASLVGCTLRARGQLAPRPDEQWSLACEWSWFVEGHWPCTYFWSWGYTDLKTVERLSVGKYLVVY